jgi:hypothetical protein
MCLENGIDQYLFVISPGSVDNRFLDEFRIYCSDCQTCLQTRFTILSMHPLYAHYRLPICSVSSNARFRIYSIQTFIFSKVLCHHLLRITKTAAAVWQMRWLRMVPTRLWSSLGTHSSTTQTSVSRSGKCGR